MTWLHRLRILSRDFPVGPVVRTLPSNAGGVGSIPGWGANIPHVSWPKNYNMKQKQYCNKFNKDFKSGPHGKKNLKKKLIKTRLCQMHSVTCHLNFLRITCCSKLSELFVYTWLN